jgi:hypothetical protein
MREITPKTCTISKPTILVNLLPQTQDTLMNSRHLVHHDAKIHKSPLIAAVVAQNTQFTCFVQKSLTISVICCTKVQF